VENSLPSAPHLRANWLSITGSVRDHNEDAVGIAVSAGAPAQFFVLCDGVGGAEAGEFVSEFAVKRMLKAFHDSPKTPGTNWSALMETTLNEINAEIRRVADAATERSGKPVMMGSTMVALVIQGWNAFVAHVGDSRLYHWRGGGIVQATEDHSTASTMMLPSIKTDGTIKRNVLMRGIGKGAAIDPDLLLLQLQPGDKLLLCSDGMSDRITAEEIAHTLGTMPLEAAPDYLARTADGRMCKDNISIIIIEVAESPVAPLTPLQQERAFIGYNTRWGAVPFAPAGITGAGRKQRPVLIGLVAVVVMAALIVALLAFSNRSGGGGTAQAQDGPTAPAIQATVVSTDTPTATATATITPSLTHTPTATPTATATPIPPTATLRSSG
jgi:serine/threonine protein phosphatase PrpC